MKKKDFFRRLGWFFLIVLVLLTYLGVYFFPTVIDINRSKREIKDIKMRIQELSQVEDAVLLTNKREKNIFRQTSRKFLSNIPKLKNNKARTIFIQKVVDHIKEIAARERIENMVMMTNGERPEVLYQTHAQSEGKKNILLKQLKHFKQTNQKNPENKNKGSGYYSHLLVNFSSKVLFTAFESGIKNGSRFINQLPFFSAYIKTERVLLVSGKPLPHFLLKLRVYYREKAKINSTQKHTRPKNIYIDFNSPLLLQPVYFNFTGSAVRRELPGQWGRTVFNKSTGDR